MDNEMKKPNDKFDYRIPPVLEFENAADATGLWFAVVVLCAFLAAGVIVYRNANSDFRLASNDDAAVTTPAGSVALPPTSPAH
jgi:uncharacterized lipoprotein YmbA